MTYTTNNKENLNIANVYCEDDKSQPMAPGILKTLEMST